MPASSTPHHRLLIAVLIVVVALMVGGGLAARELYRQPEQTLAAVTLPSSTALPLAEQPGPATVELTLDAAAHPQHEDVRVLIQQYFDSINSRNYEAWKGTVTRARVQSKPPAKWKSEYQSTKDGSILVYRIDSLPKGDLRLLVAFTSTQDPSAAPPELPAPCLHWNLVLPVTLEGGHLRVDAVTGAATPEMSPC